VTDPEREADWPEPGQREADWPEPGEPELGGLEPGGLEPGPRVADRFVRVAGGVVALLAGVVTAVWTLLLVPLRLEAGSWLVRLPVAVVLAVVGNVLLLWFARRATGSRWGVPLPAVGWFAVMLPALGATTEGDHLLLSNDWVAMLTLFGGTITLTIGVVLGMVPTPAGAPRTR